MNTTVGGDEKIELVRYKPFDSMLDVVLCHKQG